MICQGPMCNLKLESRGRRSYCPATCQSRAGGRQSDCLSCGYLRPLDGEFCRFCGTAFQQDLLGFEPSALRSRIEPIASNGAGRGRAKCYFAITTESLFAFDSEGRLSRLSVRGTRTPTRNTTDFNVELGQIFGIPLPEHYPIRTRYGGAVVWVALRGYVVEFGNGDSRARLLWDIPGAAMCGVPCELRFAWNKFVGVLRFDSGDYVAVLLERRADKLCELGRVELPSGYVPHFPPIAYSGGAVLVDAHSRCVEIAGHQGNSLVIRCTGGPVLGAVPWASDDREDMTILHGESSGDDATGAHVFGGPSTEHRIASITTGAAEPAQSVRSQFVIDGVRTASQVEWMTENSAVYGWNVPWSFGALEYDAANNWKLHIG